MASNIASGFPHPSGPFVDQEGRITQTWLQFLVSLWNRTGQAGDGPITGIAAGAGLIESQLGSIVTVAFGNISPGDMLANIGDSDGPADHVQLTQYLDDVIGDQQGSLMFRDVDKWEVLLAGSDGFSLTAHGLNNDLNWEQHGTLYNVSDGTNVVNGVTELLFNGNTFNITDLTGGVAQVDDPGGGGGNGTVNEVSDGTNNLTNISEIWFDPADFSVAANANAAIADVGFIAATSVFNGALVHLTGNITSPNNTTATISWDASVYDTDSWYNHGAQPTRLTVPTGVSYVVLSANIRLNSPATMELILIKNGAQVVDAGFNPNSTALSLNATSGPIPVTPGDYFEFVLYTSSPQTIDSTKPQWFSIEQVG